MQDPAPDEVHLAAEAECEGNIEERGCERRTDSHLTNESGTEQVGRQTHDREAEPHQLSEAWRCLGLEFGGGTKPRAHEATVEHSVRLGAQTDESAEGKHEGLPEQQGGAKRPRPGHEGPGEYYDGDACTQTGTARVDARGTVTARCGRCVR